MPISTGSTSGHASHPLMTAASRSALLPAREENTALRRRHTPRDGSSSAAEAKSSAITRGTASRRRRPDTRWCQARAL